MYVCQHLLGDVPVNSVTPCCILFWLDHPPTMLHEDMWCITILDIIRQCGPVLQRVALYCFKTQRIIRVCSSPMVAYRIVLYVVIVLPCTISHHDKSYHSISHHNIPHHRIPTPYTLYMVQHYTTLCCIAKYQIVMVFRILIQCVLLSSAHRDIVYDMIPARLIA